MFRSYDYKYLGFNNKTDQWRYEITIMDDNFTETAVAAAVADVGDNDATRIAAVLIDIYSRRNLNVAGNLVLLMQYIENKWSRDIKRQIELYQEHIIEYQKYHDQVMGYLVFI